MSILKESTLSIQIIFVIVSSLILFRRIKLDDFDIKEACDEVASLTEGLSGRNLSHLVMDIQKKTLSSEDGLCTRKLMIDRTKEYLESDEKVVGFFSSCFVFLCYFT